MRRSIIHALTAYALLASTASQCFAILINTDTLGNMKRGQAEYFNTNAEQRSTLKVHLLGGVNAPGLYKVPDNANLLEAVALAGGTAPSADLGKVHVRRTVNGELKTLDFDLANLVSDKTRAAPTLANNDVILIEHQSNQISSTLGIVATIMGIISSGLLAYVTINNLSKTK